MLLYGFIRSDKTSRIVGSKEVPGIETRKVLQSPEKLVTADCEGLSALASWNAEELNEDGVGILYLWLQQNEDNGLPLDDRLLHRRPW